MGHPVFLRTRLREKDTAKLLRLSPGLEKDLEFEEETISESENQGVQMIRLISIKKSNWTEINVLDNTKCDWFT